MLAPTLETVLSPEILVSLTVTRIDYAHAIPGSVTSTWLVLPRFTFSRVQDRNAPISHNWAQSCLVPHPGSKSKSWVELGLECWLYKPEPILLTTLALLLAVYIYLSQKVGYKSGCLILPCLPYSIHCQSHHFYLLNNCFFLSPLSPP